MPLNIEDDATVDPVARLAELRSTTGQAAVRPVAQAVPLRDRLQALWRDYPLPEPTGLAADKAFFDELSGEE